MRVAISSGEGSDSSAVGYHLQLALVWAIGTQDIGNYPGQWNPPLRLHQ